MPQISWLGITRTRKGECFKFEIKYFFLTLVTCNANVCFSCHTFLSVSLSSSKYREEISKDNCSSQIDHTHIFLVMEVRTLTHQLRSGWNVVGRGAAEKYVFHVS